MGELPDVIIPDPLPPLHLRSETEEQAAVTETQDSTGPAANTVAPKDSSPVVLYLEWQKARAEQIRDALELANIPIPEPKDNISKINSIIDEKPLGTDTLTNTSAHLTQTWNNHRIVIGSLPHPSWHEPERPTDADVYKFRQRLEARIEQLWAEFEREGVDVSLPEINRPSQNKLQHLTALESMQEIVDHLEQLWRQTFSDPVLDWPLTSEEAEQATTTTQPPPTSHDNLERRVDQLKVAIEALKLHPEQGISNDDQKTLQTDAYNRATRASALTGQEADIQMMKLSLINMYESRFKSEHLPLWTETNAAEKRLLDRKQLWDRVAQLDAAIYDVDEPNVDLIYASGESEERMHAIETGMVRTHIDTWERMCAGQLPEWPRKLYGEGMASKVLGAVKGLFSK